MRKVYYISAVLLLNLTGFVTAQENQEHKKSSHLLKRHKVGAFLGNSLIAEVKNTQTGKEQYVLAPTFGLDYEYWLSRKWAIGTYNEIAHTDIEVETDNHEEYIKRENVMLFSAVAIFEPIHNLAFFAGTGVETDPHHTFWIRYLGIEYTFIRSNDWDVSISAGCVNKDLYDAFTFGVVIGRRFGNHIHAKAHH
jgi:hypothetical protein